MLYQEEQKVQAGIKIKSLNNPEMGEGEIKSVSAEYDPNFIGFTIKIEWKDCTTSHFVKAYSARYLPQQWQLVREGLIFADQYDDYVARQKTTDEIREEVTRTMEALSPQLAHLKTLQARAQSANIGDLRSVVNLSELINTIDNLGWNTSSLDC